MTMIGAFAGFFLKKASSIVGIKKLVFNNYYLYVGIILYLLSAIINIFILRFLDYSVILPLTSITYIWTMIISSFLLKEKISMKKVIGIMMICLGTFIIVH
jgi:drug/metabolite transporter (DMT)-like permease